MRVHFLLIVMLIMLTATAASPQVAPSATGGSPTSDTQMMTPPPVSGAPYPTEVGSEARTNYLRGGLTSTTAFISNFYSGSGGTSIGETLVSVLPTIAYDATTARQHISFTYSPGFTFYQPSSELNVVDNTATIHYNYRLTPHLTLSASDNFLESPLPFITGETGTSGAVSGMPGSSTPGVTPPFARVLTNSANVEITAQTGLNVMIGGSGLATESHYPDPTEVLGLYDSNSRGGTAFYNHRISRTQYFGANYQYMDMLANPTSGTSSAASPTGGTFSTVTHTISGFYTFYPKSNLSLSVTFGPQHYRTVEAPLAAMGSWGLSFSASTGWQGPHTSFAASYSQGVTGGGGLLGAYDSKSANATTGWQMARTWTASGSGAYSIIKSVGTIIFPGESNGHSVSGGATLNHSLGSQFSIAFNYDRIHESYDGVAVITANPNTDSETISISWHFQRPLGR